MVFTAPSQAKRKEGNWQLQEAKAMFSEVIKLSLLAPQTITVHGKPTAVILSFDEYNKLISPKQTIFEFFQNSPLRGIELELPPREIEEARELFL